MKELLDIIQQLRLDLVNARKDTLNEAIKEINKGAVPIAGTPYICGPQKWVKMLEDIK